MSMIPFERKLAGELPELSYAQIERLAEQLLDESTGLAEIIWEKVIETSSGGYDPTVASFTPGWWSEDDIEAHAHTIRDDIQDVLGKIITLARSWPS